MAMFFSLLAFASEYPALLISRSDGIVVAVCTTPTNTGYRAVFPTIVSLLIQSKPKKISIWHNLKYMNSKF